MRLPAALKKKKWQRNKNITGQVTMTEKEGEAPSAGVSREVYCVLWGVDSVCMRMSALQ